MVQLITNGFEGDSGRKWSCDPKHLHVGGGKAKGAFQVWRAEVVQCYLGLKTLVIHDKVRSLMVNIAITIIITISLKDES